MVNIPLLDAFSTKPTKDELDAITKVPGKRVEIVMVFEIAVKDFEVD